MAICRGYHAVSVPLVGEANDRSEPGAAAGAIRR